MESDLNLCGNCGIWLTDVTHGSKSQSSRASRMLQKAEIPSHWSWLLEHEVTPPNTSWSSVAAMKSQERLCNTEKSLTILFPCPRADSAPDERGTEAGRLWIVLSISSMWENLRSWEPTRKMITIATAKTGVATTFWYFDSSSLTGKAFFLISWHIQTFHNTANRSNLYVGVVKKYRFLRFSWAIFQFFPF